MTVPQPVSLHTQHLICLVQRMRQGDPSASNELLRRAGERLECLARRMLRGYPVVRAQEQTADVLQVASLGLLDALKVVTPNDTRHFFALAGREINRRLIALARHHRRGVPQVLHNHDEPAAAGTGRADVQELERWQALHEEVERLPNDQREVFHLRFYHDRTWLEIAELLQINERTARRRWDGACIALREALGGWAPPDEGEASPNPGT